jgi:hypothetical protein
LILRRQYIAKISSKYVIVGAGSTSGITDLNFPPLAEFVLTSTKWFTFLIRQLTFWINKNTDGDY